MKAVRILAAVLAVAALMTCGCTGSKKQPDELPKMASDPELLKMWDAYSMLDGVPRYSLGGIFDNFYTGEDGSVVVSFFGVSADDYEAYCAEVLASGYRLKEGSDIWVNQGMSGVPIFYKGTKGLTLIWNMNGNLDISSEPTVN
ncbi:MAG: hypothetical protein II124_05005 [Clostridia bacterium]|nr:hypothetical protein [Clostridia bacterium]